MEQLESTQAAIAPAGRDLMRSHLADAELARLKSLRDARVRALLARRSAAREHRDGRRDPVSRHRRDARRSQGRRFQHRLLHLTVGGSEAERRGGNCSGVHSPNHHRRGEP